MSATLPANVAERLTLQEAIDLLNELLERPPGQEIKYSRVTAMLSQRHPAVERMREYGKKEQGHWRFRRRDVLYAATHWPRPVPGRPRVLTLQKVGEIRQRLDGGEPLLAIARDLGVNPGTIYRHVIWRRYDDVGRGPEGKEWSRRVYPEPPTRTAGPKLPPVTADEMIDVRRWLKEGASVGEAADALGVDVMSIRRALDRWLKEQQHGSDQQPDP